jgi:V/A-type H+/Na+-transporting ATPase subunit K
MVAKAVLLVGLAIAALLCCAGRAFGADEAVQAGAGVLRETGIICMAAAIAVGLACIASGFALARIGSAAMGAMSEKPELGGRALIFLGMAEGIAIYGLIIAIMILNKL